MSKIYSALFAFLFFCFTQTLSAQTYNPGDLAVLGFNADQSTDLDGDGFQDARWAIVVLRQLSIGSVIHFTDAGITETGQFYLNSNNEGHLTWSITTVVPAGKVFVMDCVDGSNFADLNGLAPGTGGLSDYGTVSGHLGGTTVGISVPFSVSGDQIIIYQGTAGTTAGATYIYGYNTQQNSLLSSPVGVWQTTGIVNSQLQSYLPTGLTNGTTAVALTTNVGNTFSGTGLLGNPNYGFDNMIYAGTRTGTRAQLLAAIGNPSNHIGDNAVPFLIGIGVGLTFAGDFTVTNALPLTWGNISGTLQQGRASLQWETIRESNTSHFDIETSVNGINYTLLKDNIPAAGNSEQPRSYRYEFPVNTSLLYIRIKQADIDGLYSYSGVISLKDDKAAYPAIINTLVTDGQLRITMPASWKNGTYSIFGSNGSHVKTARLTETNGGQKSIDIGKLLPGTYHIIFADGKQKISSSFIKN